MEKREKTRTGKRNGKKFNKNLIWIAGAAAVLLIVAVCLLMGNDTEDRSDPISGPMEKMVIHSVEEQGKLVCVKTSYGDFSYPFAFSDLVVMEPVNEESYVGLAFSAYIGGNCEPVYTLWINSDRGMTAGTLRVEDKTYSVTLEIMDAREDLDANSLSTFNAVQETLNDVLQSLAAGGNFEYAMGGA